MAKGDQRQLFKQAYYNDPEMFNRREWTPSGALDGPGIVQQYFLSKAVMPAFLTGGVYNPISGSDWSKHWLWPRALNLAEHNIHRSVRKLFPRDDTSWASDDDDTLDICMGVADGDRVPGVDGENGDGGDTSAPPARKEPANESKKRGRRGIKGRPKGSGNKKGKKGSSIGQVVAATTAATDGGMEVVTFDQQTLQDDDMNIEEEKSMAPAGANNSDDMIINYTTTEGWVQITDENALQHSELLHLI